MQKLNQTVFKQHTIVCGWNQRGKSVVNALRKLCDRPMLVIDENIGPIIAEVGSLPNVFIIRGDPSEENVLRQADVTSAKSVLVLARYDLGHSADARSVQIALAVEQIQVEVTTVVELLDVKNKTYFSWTKVDDLVTSENIAVRLLAQGVRSATAGLNQASPVELYRQLVNPGESHSQIYRVDLSWTCVRQRNYSQILSCALRDGIIPLAFIGYRRHEISRPTDDAWRSWKTDTRANPPPRTAVCEIWPDWPGDSTPLGVLVLAKNQHHALMLLDRCNAGNF